MERKQQDRVALHRWAVIAEAANDRLTAAERGALVRQTAARAHTHPDGSARGYSRDTIDRWLRAWRKGGLEALRPAPRADTGVVRAHPWQPAGEQARCVDHGRAAIADCDDDASESLTR